MISGVSSIDEGSSYSLSLNPGGWDPADLRWRIDWGDGVIQQFTGMAGVATHAYADGPAGYTLSATANDGIGNYKLLPLAVMVENADPAVGFQADPPDQMTAGEAATIISTVSDVAADMAAGFTYQWSVTKDGQPHVPNTPVDQAAFSFTPSLAGTYLITLSATDKDGGVGMVSRQVAMTFGVCVCYVGMK